MPTKQANVTHRIPFDVEAEAICLDAVRVLALLRPLRKRTQRAFNLYLTEEHRSRARHLRDAVDVCWSSLYCNIRFLADALPLEAARQRVKQAVRESLDRGESPEGDETQ